MSGQLFISLLNPGIGALLAIAFLLLWMHGRNQLYVLHAAWGYAAMAVAFLIQDLAPSLPYEAQRIPSNLAFLASACLIVGATIGRYGVPVPWRRMLAIAGTGMAVFLWFLLGAPSITGRILTISITLGVVAAQLPLVLYRVPRAHLIDSIIFWIGVLSAANFILRPVLIVALTGAVDTYDGFQQTIYWTTVQFTQALISILFALSLMVAVAIDLMAELRHQADSDTLSGLLNRRGFEAAAGSAVRACADGEQSVALLIADLDHFKAINDSQGHPAGDAIIAAFGAHIRALAPPGTIAGRIGGEEFALLLPGAGIDTARSLAEAIRTGMAGTAAPGIPAPTVSIGLTGAAIGARLSQLMQDADEALYEAKRAGRNRVRAFTPASVDTRRIAAS